MSQTFSAPKAYIEIDGIKVGLMTNISWTENISRQYIRGLGQLEVQEAPATAKDNTFNAAFFFVSFDSDYMKRMLNRNVPKEIFINTLSMDEFTFSIVIYRKTVTGQDLGAKLIKSVNPTGETVAKLQNCVLDNQTWQLAEGGVATTNVTGRYFTPMVLG